MTKPEPPRRSAHQIVLEALRADITSGRLAPGSQHSIYQLAERFGVSRTPVREAVLQLASTGMVTIERNRGVRVRGLSVTKVHEIFDLRLLLEVPAAAAAAAADDPGLADRLFDCLAGMRRAIHDQDIDAFTVADRSLHREVLRATGNDRLVAEVEDLRDATFAMGASTMNRSRRLQQVEDEHVPVVQAIAAGDSVAAAAAMRRHLLATATLVMRQVARETGEAIPLGWTSGEDHDLTTDHGRT